jgi:hypothetical protein
MGANKSQRNGALILFGFIAAVYLFNIFIFSLSKERQLNAGGLALIALGAAWIYLLGAPETLSCDRTHNTCRLIRPRFLLTPKSVETFPLDRVRDVHVMETSVTSHDGPSRKGYEVRLEIEDARRAHVFSTEDSERRADAIVRRVESFLKDEGQLRLTVRRFPWAMIAFGAALVIFGAWLVLGGATGWPSALRG